MNTKMYAICFTIALLGMLFSIALKAGSLQKKARVANAKFSIGQFVADDWLSSLASFIFIIICLFLIDTLFKWKPAVVDYVKPIFVFIGYFGGDLGSRLFSVTNKRLNDVIDYKTSAADEVQGTVDTPMKTAPKDAEPSQTAKF
jgi:hypothetical protein